MIKLILCECFLLVFSFAIWLVGFSKRLTILSQANKIGRINLAATGKDLMDDEKPGDVTIDLFAAIDMETEAVEERIPELEKNQTLGLLTGFLSVDDWYICSSSCGMSVLLAFTCCFWPSPNCTFYGSLKK